MAAPHLSRGTTHHVAGTLSPPVADAPGSPFGFNEPTAELRKSSPRYLRLFTFNESVAGISFSFIQLFLGEVRSHAQTSAVRGHVHVRYRCRRTVERPGEQA